MYISLELQHNQIKQKNQQYKKSLDKHISKMILSHLRPRSYFARYFQAHCKLVLCSNFCTTPFIQPQSPVVALKTKSQFHAYPIQSYEAGQRLDRYLKNTKLNWILAQKFLRERTIYIVNTQGKRIVQNDYKLQKGDIMYVKANAVPLIHNQKPASTQSVSYQYAKKKLDEMIIFDNKNITILNKPANYSVQGGQQLERNLFTLMAARYKKQFVHVTHRLDKPTTGVLFFCKNLLTAQLIQGLIQHRSNFCKYYLSVSVGKQIPKQEEYIRCNIQWTKKQKARIIQSMEKEDSKDCITYYNRITQNILTNGQYANLLGIKLITGRKHQIRCHLHGYLDNPILNDRRYGGIMIKDNIQQLKIQSSKLKIQSIQLNRQSQLSKLNRQSQKSKLNKQLLDNKSIQVIDTSPQSLKVVEKELIQEKIQQQKFIFLHALMSTINSPQIATKVFQISQQKIFNSAKSPSSLILSHNENGTIYLKDGLVKIIGSLPSAWKNLQKPITLNSNLQTIILKEQINQIELAQSIQMSQKNLWRRHRPQQKVQTIK